MGLKRLWLLGAAAAATVTVVAAAGTSSSRDTGPGCANRWRVLARPAADLSAVAALSSTDVWAVGQTGSGAARRSVIGHWDGARLRLRPGLKGRSLSALATVSPTNVWAVGSDESKAVMLHWNGRRWRRVSTPAGILSLGDIVMHSATSGWAVGFTTDYRPVALRWNGRTWRKLVLLRRPREGGLNSLTAVSARDVWAVGSTGGEHSINTIDAFAVHWNGQSWRAVSAPARDDGELGTELNDGFGDVAAVSATEVWAIHGANVRDDIQRWDGRRWRVVRVFGRDLDLRGLIAFRGTAWVLGSRAGHPFLLNRTRDGWRVAGRELARLRGGLIDASALSPSQIWAAGSQLLARYGC